MRPLNPEFAQVEILSADDAGKILSAPSIDRIRALYGIIFPLTMVVAVGLLAGAGILYRQGIDEEDHMKSTLALALGIIGVLQFVILLAVSFVVGTRNQWLQRIARNEINRRPEKIVDPKTPRARFVEVVPKSNWNNAALGENATDVGFLFLDLEGGWLLYEGDNERYRIPGPAIVGCQQDSYTRLIQSPFSKAPRNKIITYHFVVITIKVSEKLNVEMPFRLRQDINLFSDQKASEANSRFFQEINQLRKTSLQAGAN